MSKEVEEPQGHLFKGKVEGDRKKERGSGRASEEVEVLCGPFFPRPLHNPKGDQREHGSGVEDRAAGYRESEAGPVEDRGDAAGPSGIESGDHPAQDSPSSSDTEAAPAASPADGPANGSSSGLATAPAAAAAAARGRAPNVTRRARKRGREDGEMPRQSQIEELLLEALKRQAQPGPPAPPDPPRQPPSEDEMFLLSLVPSLQRLSPQRKE
ncbi:uncharacterized protein LOC126398882 [Epinephelus moara]|uniref:uncharacterized protein LOC126398882 n=1 Tax=Epinephelus moara TaxID=300413 RepID=UPI00214F4CDD|nr:uncharacterized protein LOC126398882 [Epinephelus moara]